MSLLIVKEQILNSYRDALKEEAETLRHHLEENTGPAHVTCSLGSISHSISRFSGSEIQGRQQQFLSVLLGGMPKR